MDRANAVAHESAPVSLLGAFGTLVGHLNHANLDLGHGAWRCVLTSPRMHLWHHADREASCNYGIIFSAWDWLFGCAYVPSHPPPRLGFGETRTFPRSLPAQWLWPLSRRDLDASRR